MPELVPWNRGRSALDGRFGGDGDPFRSLYREMNRMFDDFTHGFGFGRDGMSNNWPHVEVSETDIEFKIVAEMPGMEEKDIDISLHDGMLTLKGEKKSENASPHYSERWQGQFERSLQLGNDVDPDKCNAEFKNGVLTITLGKRAEAQRQVKHIPIGNG